MKPYKVGLLPFAIRILYTYFVVSFEGSGGIRQPPISSGHGNDASQGVVRSALRILTSRSTS